MTNTFNRPLISGSMLYLLLSLAACHNQTGAIQASGTIEATEIRISAKTSGEVVELPVQEGSLVKKGDVIARIDASTLELRRAQAQAGVALAEANFSKLVKGARSEDIKQAEEQLIQARENYGQAEEDYKRMQKLFETNSVTRKQLDDAQTRYSVVKAQAGAAEAGLNKLRHLAQPEDIKIVQAQLDQAKIGLLLLEKQITDSTVIAPGNGTITHKLVEVGEFAGAGTPLCILADLSTVSVTIYVNEKDLGYLQIGQEARVYIDSFKNQAFIGHIAYISPIAEFTPKNIQTKEERVKQVFAVKIDVANTTGSLKAGLPADALITLPAVSPVGSVKKDA